MLKLAVLLCLAAVSHGFIVSKHQPINHRALLKRLGVGQALAPRLTDLNDIIPFYQTLKMIENTNELIEQHINFDEKPPATDPNRHYMVLLGVIYRLIEDVAETCNVDPNKYDEDYLKLVEEGLSNAWNDPKDMADKIHDNLDMAAQRIVHIRSTIHFICGDNNKSPVLCNLIISKIINNPTDKEQTKQLLTLGEIATLFSEISPYLEEVANNQQEISFLLDPSTKDLLKPFVLSVVEFIVEVDVARNCGKMSVYPIGLPLVSGKRFRSLNSLRAALMSRSII